MKRLQDGFIDLLATEIGLAGKRILEIGCGNGSRSVEIAAHCRDLTAIDPAGELIADAARLNASPNLTYQEGRAEDLKFADGAFDVVIFSLSLHHVPASGMATALQEAARVLAPSGRVVVFEPGWSGSFFEAELRFHSSDGDERLAKAQAYVAALSCPELHELAEVYDEAVLEFESTADFSHSLAPSKDLDQLEAFLSQHKYILSAQRRTNIFRKYQHD